MNYNELKHHGVKGMKWGVRRSKAQLARRTGRNEDDISDAEAKQFEKDVKRYNTLTSSPSMRMKLYEKNRAEKGKEYASAVLKQSVANRRVKTLTSLAAVTAGKAAVEIYTDRKLGIVKLGNGATLYTKPEYAKMFR